MNPTKAIAPLFFLAMSGTAPASTVVPCDVSAYGTFPTGESFSGSWTEDGTSDFLLDWRHSAPGVEFETLETNPDTATCNVNGSVNADVLGSGTATVNGTAGYSYLIYIEDNRAAPDSLLISASIVRTPTRRSDGLAIFDAPREVTIPAAIDVTHGGSGSGWAKLHVDDVTCRFRGTGTTYAFERCTGPTAAGYAPGDRIYVSTVRLRIQKSDNAYDMTSVEVDIGTGEPVPGTPDVYNLQVFDPLGDFFYGFVADVVNGDISIVVLP